MNRIAQLEQGSQQTQGETLELGLAPMLKSAFRMDQIQPVPKGVTDSINTITEGRARGWAS
jgi:hypothetical protein